MSAPAPSGLQSSVRSPRSGASSSGQDEDTPPMRGTMLAGMAGVLNVDIVPDKVAERVREVPRDDTVQQRFQRELCEAGCPVTLFRQLSGEPSKKVWLELEPDRLTFRSLTRKQEVLAFKKAEEERRLKIEKKNERMEEKKKLAEQQGKKEKVTYTKQPFVKQNIPDKVKDCTIFIVDIEDGDDGVELYDGHNDDDVQKFERDPSWGAALLEEGPFPPSHCLRVRYRNFTIGQDSELCVLFDKHSPDRHACHPKSNVEGGVTAPIPLLTGRKAAKRRKGPGGTGDWSAEEQRDAWFHTLKRLQFGACEAGAPGKKSVCTPSAVEAFEMSPLKTLIDKTWVFADEDGGGKVNTKTEVEDVLQFCNIFIKRKKLVNLITEVLTSKWGMSTEEGKEWRMYDAETIRSKVEAGEVDLSKPFFERLLWKCRGSGEIVDELWNQYARDMTRMPLVGEALESGFDKFLDSQDNPKELRAKRNRQEKRIREAFADAAEGMQDKKAIEVREREMRTQIRALDKRWRLRRAERESRRDIIRDMVQRFILHKHKDELSKGKFTTFLMHSALNSAFSPWCIKDWVGNQKQKSEWMWPPADTPRGPVMTGPGATPVVEAAELGVAPWDRPLRDFYISTSVNTAYGAVRNPIDVGEPKERPEKAEGADPKQGGWDYESYLPRVGPLPAGATKFLTAKEAVERVMSEFNPRAIHIGVGAMPLEAVEDKFLRRKRGTGSEETYKDALQRMMKETDIWPFKRGGDKGWWKLVVGHRDLDQPLDHWSRAERGAREGNYPQDFSEQKHGASQLLYDGKKTAKAYRRGVPFRQILEVVRDNAFPPFCDTPLVLILEVPDQTEVLDHIATELWDVLGPRAEMDGEDVDPSVAGLLDPLHTHTDGEMGFKHTQGPLQPTLNTLGLAVPWGRPGHPSENTIVTPEDELHPPPSRPHDQPVKVRDLGGVGSLPLRLLRKRIIVAVKMVRSQRCENHVLWRDGRPEWASKHHSAPTLASVSRALHRLTGLELVPGNARGPPPTPAELGFHPVAEWSVTGMPLCTKKYEEVNGQAAEMREVVSQGEWQEKFYSGDVDYPQPHPVPINWPRCPDAGVFADRAGRAQATGGRRARDSDVADGRSETQSRRSGESGATGATSVAQRGGRAGGVHVSNPFDEVHHGEHRWRRDDATRMLSQLPEDATKQFNAGVRANSDYVISWTEAEVREKLNESRLWQQRMATDAKRKLREELSRRRKETGYHELMPADEDLPAPRDFVNPIHSWTREHLTFVTAARELNEREVLELRSLSQKEEDYKRHEKRTGMKFDKTSFHKTGEFKGQRNARYDKWTVRLPEDEALSGTQCGIVEAWSAGCQFVGIDHLPDPNTLDGQHAIVLRSLYRSKFRMSYKGASGFVLKPTPMLSVPDPRAPPRVRWAPGCADWILKNYKDFAANKELAAPSALSRDRRLSAVFQYFGATTPEDRRSSEDRKPSVFTAASQVSDRGGAADIGDEQKLKTQEDMDEGKRWRETGACNFSIRICAGHFLPPETEGDDEDVNLLDPRDLLGPFGKLLGGKKSKYDADIVDPFVEVRIDGVERDCTIRKTRTIQNNGYCPIWNDSFTMPISEKEHAILTITINDDDGTGKKSFLCRSSIPIAAMQLGMRSLFLYDENEKRISFNPTLLVDLKEIQAGDEQQKRVTIKQLDDTLEQNKIALREKRKQLEQIRDTVANQGKQLTTVRIEKDAEARVRDKYHRSHCVCEPADSCVVL
eukprot:TRINITY_DN44079_c0_g1_i1.p1 TRINITY_DN44079_c0_g1~~TRINITY_DN44079_c0_g1_i1.p1  ORF type:complete len:1741 (+),score=482.54 TRINITY_DN44079_c0_g1_i1:104-5326(+)